MFHSDSFDADALVIVTILVIVVIGSGCLSGCVMRARFVDIRGMGTRRGCTTTISIRTIRV